MEKWKEIPGFENYLVSNTGNVKRKELTRIVKDSHGGYMVRHDSEKMIAVTDNGNGYLIASITQNGKRKNFYVHRLVANAFLERDVTKEYVNHIDFDKKNNNVSNLEWCTQKENIAHSLKHLCKPKNRIGSTGEKYISYRKSSGEYRVAVPGHKEYRFKDIESAVKCRNEVMNYE